LAVENIKITNRKSDKDIKERVITYIFLWYQAMKGKSINGTAIKAGRIRNITIQLRIRSPNRMILGRRRTCMDKHSTMVPRGTYMPSLIIFRSQINKRGFTD
jgi:hypothetical protein